MAAKLHFPDQLGEGACYPRGNTHTIVHTSGLVLVHLFDERTVEYLWELLDGVIVAKRERIYAYVHPCIRDQRPELHQFAFIVRLTDLPKVLPFLQEPTTRSSL